MFIFLRLWSKSYIFLFHYHFNIFLRVNFNCSKIYYRGSWTSIVACTCSSLTFHGANAPSSTLTCMWFCIFNISKPPPLITPPTPFANLIETYSSYPAILIFFRIDIYQKIQKPQNKIRTTTSWFISNIPTSTKKQKKTPTPITAPATHHS